VLPPSFNGTSNVKSLQRAVEHDGANATERPSVGLDKPHDVDTFRKDGTKRVRSLDGGTSIRPCCCCHQPVRIVCASGADYPGRCADGDSLNANASAAAPMWGRLSSTSRA
jgi:hypothetical protein